MLTVTFHLEAELSLEIQLTLEQFRSELPKFIYRQVF